MSNPKEEFNPTVIIGCPASLVNNIAVYPSSSTCYTTLICNIYEICNLHNVKYPLSEDSDASLSLLNLSPSSGVKANNEAVFECIYCHSFKRYIDSDSIITTNEHQLGTQYLGK